LSRIWARDSSPPAKSRYLTRVSPFADEPPREHTRGAVRVRPPLVIETAFAIWTPEARLRAASYQDLRDDKNPADVTREP
jgi:bifunctional non-homologous end joining protein LigD